MSFHSSHHPPSYSFKVRFNSLSGESQRLRFYSVDAFSLSLTKFMTSTAASCLLTGHQSNLELARFQTRLMECLDQNMDPNPKLKHQREWVHHWVVFGLLGHRCQHCKHFRQGRLFWCTCR